MLNSNGNHTCDEVNSGWTCSKDRGHYDAHEAYGSHRLDDPEVFRHAWPNTLTVSDEEVEAAIASIMKTNGAS